MSETSQFETKRLSAPSNPWAPSAGYLKRRALIARAIKAVLFSAALASVGVTLGILYVLLSESWAFFESVSVWDFLTDTQWTPLFEDAHFGILPLLSATLTVTLVALSFALPAGLTLAIYLSEFANHSVRETVKPILELLEGVPTVIYGYFALLLVTPMLQHIMPNLPGFNLLAPGLVIGIMILPYVTSVSEDAMRAVPDGLREGAYALGFNRLQTAIKVVVPAALSGITAAFVLGMSRAIGETMVVAIAGGQNPNLTFNPAESAAAIPAYIVQVSMGDLPQDSIAYKTIFTAGLALFLITLMFNLIGYALKRHFREVY
jgi:phosphate transport system permease protein